MPTYKYLYDDQRVVAVIDDDGISRMSCLASVLPENTTIEPADDVIANIPQSAGEVATAQIVSDQIAINQLKQALGLK